MLSETIKTPVGPLTVAADDLGITRVTFGASRIPTRKRPSQKAKAHLRQGVSALKRYFSGDLRALDRLQVHLDGTPLQVLVWKELAQIPAGKVRSYAEVARRIGSPTAIRAIGTACGKNPVCVIIPCHRVVASDGTLGGFSGGLATKRKLLRHEGVALSGRSPATPKKPTRKASSTRRRSQKASTRKGSTPSRRTRTVRSGRR